MTNFTRPRELDGEYNFVAGVGLINASRLIKWDKNAVKFVMPSPGGESFENLWDVLDPQLGRVILWNAFSNGAEYLFKGLLLANNIEGVRKLSDPKPVQPTEAEIADGAAAVRHSSSGLLLCSGMIRAIPQFSLAASRDT